MLGESAAQGTPAPAFGFARILEVMLAREHPGRRFEVVNVAMRGINSHVIREIAAECGRFEPDLFLIYMGDQRDGRPPFPEPGVEPHALPAPAPCQPWARSTGWRNCIGTRRARWARNRPGASRTWNSPAEPSRCRGAPQRRAVYDNFQANLEDILRAGRAARRRCCLDGGGQRCRISRRWRRFTGRLDGGRSGAAGKPLTLVGRQRQRRAVFSPGPSPITGKPSAWTIISRPPLQPGAERTRPGADGRRPGSGSCWPANGTRCRSRADERLNRIIREAAAAGKSAVWCWWTRKRLSRTEAARAGGLPGNKLFYEHVHLTFDGDYLLGRQLRGTRRGGSRPG